MADETPQRGAGPGTKCPAPTKSGGLCPNGVKYPDPDGLWRCSGHSTSKEAIAYRKAQAAEGRAAKAVAKRRAQAERDVLERRAGVKLVSDPPSPAKGANRRRSSSGSAATALDEEEPGAVIELAAPTKLRSLEDCLTALEAVFAASYRTRASADLLRARIAAVEGAKKILVDEKYEDPNAEKTDKRAIAFAEVKSMEEYKLLVEENRRARAAAGAAAREGDDGAD